MYHHHYGLKQAPFSISPDPRFLYMSERHREALAHLVHGVSGGGGFILLTGEVGTGKTTLCRCLLEQLPDNVRLAYVLNPRVSPVELLQTICDELRIALPDAKHSIKALTDVITERLIDNHRRGLNTVLMIDEAQQLSTDCLEQVRLLTNLETTEKKLLQIVLIGQPELQEKLATKELRQLAQRITARYHLLPLSLHESASYVLHRLQLAGLQRSPFTRTALRALHRYSGGIPRLINTISERALMAGFARHRTTINEFMMCGAAKETLGALEFARRTPLARHRPVIIITMVVVLVLAASLLGGYLWQPHATPTPDVTALAHEIAPTPTTIDAASTPSDDRDEIVTVLLGEQAFDRRGDDAARTLLQQWQHDFVAVRDGNWCAFAETKTLRCENGYADWGQMAALNLPLIVRLQSPTRGPFYAAVTRLTDDNITLRFGRREALLPRVDFEKLWSGEYTLLWQAPFEMKKALSEGSSGPNVIWLSTALAQAQGLSGSATVARFDAGLTEQVKQFQQQHALVADGVVGTQTLIALSSRQPGSQPRLDGVRLP